MKQVGGLKITILTDRDSWMNRYDRELEERQAISLFRVLASCLYLESRIITGFIS